MTRRELILEIQHALGLAGVSDAKKNAAWMGCEVWSCSRAALLTHEEMSVLPAEEDKLRGMAERRAWGEPLQYILEHTDFFGLQLKVSPAALIPRPETEFVVEQAIALITPHINGQPRILDVGTGTGCIALALKKELPNADVWACDAIEEALALARENAVQCGLEVSLIQADVLNEASARGLPGKLDLLISNPPYIPDSERVELPREVGDYEPAEALFAGEDPLLFYRHLARLGRELLADAGLIAFETHADFAGEVATLLEETGYGGVRIKEDLAGRPRFVSGRYSFASMNS